MSMAYQVYEDEHVAGVYRALSLRFLIRYVDMLSSTDSFAGKTTDHGLLPTRRYRRAVDEWVRRPAESAHAALALVEFAGVLAADRLTSDVLRDPLPGAEMDAGDQAIALAAAAEWLNRGALREQGVIRDEPSRPAMSKPERTKLRARAEALAVELATPLPEGDAGLVEAERRLRENEAQEKELYRDFRESPDHLEIEAELIHGMIDPALDQLRSFLENTTAISLPGALAKLRFVADPRRDYLERGDVAQAMVADVVAVLEREAQP
jgi:hypothetical protein